MIASVKVIGAVPQVVMPNLEPMANEIGLHMVNSVQRNFQAGGRPEQWRARWDNSPSFLYETGRLMGSIQHRIERDGAGWNIYVSPEGVPYAALQQEGGSTPTGGYVHPRPYLVIQDEDRQWIEQNVLQYMLENTIKTGKHT